MSKRQRSPGTLIRLALATVIAVPLALAGSPLGGLAPAASQTPGTATHLKIPGVPGGSNHAGHSNEIVVLSWSWSMQSEGEPAKAIPGDATFAIPTSQATPKLLEACALGTLWSQVELAETNPQGIDYMKVRFENALCNTYTIEGAQASDAPPTGSFSIAFDAIKIQYHRLGEDGKPEPAVTGGWNFKTNRRA